MQGPLWDAREESPIGTPCIGALRRDRGGGCHAGYCLPTTGSVALPSSALAVAEPCSSAVGREGRDLISPRVSNSSNRWNRLQL